MGIAATPAGSLFVGSVVTGEILRFRPGSTSAETFVPAEPTVLEIWLDVHPLPSATVATTFGGGWRARRS